MKIIEAMRKIKTLDERLSGLVIKIREHSSDNGEGEPVYITVQDQVNKIKEWVQCYKDTVKEIERLRVAIQRTNIAVEVPVTMSDDSIVKKTIAAWIHRRRDLSKKDAHAWEALRCPHKPRAVLETDGKGACINPRRYYDMNGRDSMLAILQAEPNCIDAALEIANATTDIIE